MNNKQKQAEVSRIKKQLIEEGNKCFFSGANGPYVAFHCVGKGRHPEYATTPRNIVLAKNEYNLNWIDVAGAKDVLTIPNCERGFVRMKEIDELYFNKKMRQMEDNLSKAEYDNFVDLVQIEMLGDLK